MSHAFVSYVRENRREVDWLCSELNRYGVETWTDRTSLVPGQRWRTGIRRAIQEGAAFLACFSPQFIEKTRTYMHEELALAVGELRMRPTETTWFIPVLLAECEVPDIAVRPGESLRDIQYVELHRDWQDGMRRILHAISELPGQELDFDRIERVDRLIEALESLRARTNSLWDSVSVGTLRHYRQALRLALTQLARAANALDPEEMEGMERLLVSAFNFRVGKNYLLRTRNLGRRRLDPLVAEQIKWQIDENRQNRREFLRLLDEMKRRQQARPIEPP